MLNFDVTPELKALISGSELSEQEKHELLKEKTVSHGNLKNFYMRCKPTLSLLKLLNTTKINVPNKNQKNSDIPKTEEFLKSMELLRLKANEEEYRNLVKPKQEYTTLYEVDDDNFSPSQAHKETKSHITTIFNIFISVASVVYAIWYWTDSSWKIKDSYRVLLCLFFGLLILVAEVVVYMSYLNKIDEAKIKERNKKEVKKVIRTVNLN
ncbi:CIC11C00000000890 [Sungouiella intermedia]|uniref:CIC11C00000000890 n=1 Tax=Sungouiella intermedia TaxID=45354 RepID=A0A1L0DRE8_9ASCO|nr:CIC11C00000000890 [[Candida] intermedia]